ncbi:MAG: DUF3343 domain-containing protein [Desulfomonilaceae bacterium]|nr:DUF3343 domain-containing protein [Desulfomonilaceae bacterium]
MRRFVNKIYDLFRRPNAGTKSSEKPLSARGIVLFGNTGEVIRAEKLLREAGLSIQIKGPPPEVRTGCDMAIEFPLVAQLLVMQTLKEADIEPLEVLPLQDLLLEPVSLFNVKDFPGFLMVRAANMKITVAKHDLRIVNVSGGGCPDVPFLADRLVGKTLLDSPEPRDLGSTLCGYALQMAYEEIKRRCLG